jgi:hypothetical protein
MGIRLFSDERLKKLERESKPRIPLGQSQLHGQQPLGCKYRSQPLRTVDCPTCPNSGKNGNKIPVHVFGCSLYSRVNNELVECMLAPNQQLFPRMLSCSLCKSRTK